MKKLLYVFAIFVIIIAAIYVYELGYARAPDTESPFPKAGIWYCDELQAWLSFSSQAETNRHSAIIIDDEEVTCVCMSDPGSSDLYLTCQERNSPQYTLGQTIYWWEFIGLSETELVLKDHYSGKQYIFDLTE